MNSEEFVGTVREVVYESAVRDTLSLIQKPPGRKPSANLVALSQWFSQLSEPDKRMVEAAIALAARQSVFGVLAVLDGVRQIEEVPEKGKLELRYMKDNRSVILNSPNSDPLHDLFNQQVPPL